jgi:hypothetical protein
MKLYYSPGTCSLAPHKHYAARVAARPKVREALRAEGLVK